ncbi:MAG TPA: response regulator transcription factor [Deltaproteobacteria bacterium]|nr:response regulator transcription factor [Deltaproteobacteria bacterium]HPP80055.1 response regulator transcription factor [Deltaproteobacteria bacterium]
MEASSVRRILIVEDHEVFRLGIKELIEHEPDLVVCGEADNVKDALALIDAVRPDMVIVDITLKNGNGMDLIRTVCQHPLPPRMLVLSMHDELLYAQRCLKAGAHGYIMKQETSRSIIKAIRRILSGDIYVSDQLVGSILKRVQSGREPVTPAPTEALSDRELDVLRMIGQGKSTSEIASAMNLSVSTIGTYRERIKEKLNLKNAAELVRYAVHWVDG